MSVTSGIQRDFLPAARWAGDPIRVLVCDDHALFRRGLIVVLEQEPDLEVLGEADSGPEAMSLAGELAPDVVLVDMGLPPYGGVATASQISRVVPTARMVLLAANERDPQELLEAVGAGAVGVLLKEAALSRLPEVVRRVARREFPLSPAVARAITDLLDSMDTDEAAPFVVTDRERLTVEIVARGADTADAVAGLDIGNDTARNLLANLVRKLQRHWRRDEAVRSLSIPKHTSDMMAPVTRAAMRIVGPTGGAG